MPEPAPAADLVPEGVTAAVAFMDSRVSNVVTGSAIAAAAGISLWELQQQFHDQFGITPRQYLRQQRLNGVHQDLLDAATDVDIARVVRRWGFAHLGRFFVTYSDTFHETPATTLTRSRTTPPGGRLLALTDADAAPRTPSDVGRDRGDGP